MFDIVLYPLSAILWFWHAVFGALLGPDTGGAWVLAIVFLVFTLRVLLLRPALAAQRAGRRAQELAPRIRKLRDRHGSDRQRLAREIQKLHADSGTSALGGCLPALLQIPVFLGLYWMLRGFTPAAGSNQVFDRAAVESFLDADLFGATLGNWISQPAAELAVFGTDRATMIAVGVPLMLVAGLATFLSMRSAAARQPAANPPMAVLTRAMTYLAPAGLLLSGLLLPMPVGVLLYFLASNVWTFGQQHVLARVLDREDRARKAARPRPTAPRPGQRPRRR